MKNEIKALKKIIRKLLDKKNNTSINYAEAVDDALEDINKCPKNYLTENQNYGKNPQGFH